MHERYRFASPYAAGKDVLDAACGTGWGWQDLGEPRSVTGIDVSWEALRDGRRLGYARRAAAAEMERLPFPGASFDVVTCMEGIEHIPARAAAAFLSECRRVLRPAGVLVLSTPLRKGGRHSGNPWHCVEYSEQEIRSLLDSCFETLESRVDQDADPPVFLFAGKPLPGQACEPRVVWSESGIHTRARSWLESVSTPDGFLFTPGGVQTVTSSAMGVLLAEGLGLALPDRDAVLHAILAAQDPATGLFLEPLAASIPQAGGHHDAEYLHAMTTYFALHALDVLGGKPRFPLCFLNSFTEREQVIAWLEALDWSNPWRESNRIMHLLSAFLFSLQWEQNAAAAARYHDVLDWLDAHQDPATGLWGTQRGASLLNAAAGAYHFVPFYRYARRPVGFWSRIIDSCLELRNGDGLFAPAPGGGACEDLDVIDLLCNAVRATGQCRPEVRQALSRAFWAIWNMQRPDGSFPYSNVEGGEVYRFSSWPAMEAETGGGDLWATWVRLAALHTIRALLGGDLPPAGAWTFRRLPALGFHLQDTAIARDAIPGHRPIWFRPLPAPPEPAEPRVSVVVTCYNLGQYLYDALSSVCGQTLKDVETVIIDDGSTDAFTIARLDALAEDGWRVMRTENRGLPAARNLGVRSTRAPFLCCLDADDRLRPEYLEKAAAALEANPRAGFVSCYYELFGESQGSCRYPRPRLPRMLARNEAVVSSLFRRQAWAAAGGYCEDLPAMQDWDFWISLLEKGWEGELLPEVLFDYRIRSGSMYSETRKPARYAKISSLIVARHRELFEQYLEEVFSLNSRFFAEHIEFSLRQEESHRQALRELRRQIVRIEQPATAPSAASTAPGVYSPQLPASWIATALWVLAQVLHPRAGWRGARNLLLFARSLASPRARAVWTSLFDAQAYAAARPDVAQARILPSLHFLFAGAWEQADPSPQFSASFYLKRHADVAARGINPLLHYSLFGALERRIIAAPASAAKPPAFSAEVREPGDLVCEPLVSVVIPCFNYGRYLEEALHSVLKQTFSNLEVIVVEGGSTDPASVALVRRLERAGLPRVRFLYRSQPHLAGDNRNFGIRHARGRYVCCLDADDLLDPAYLETAVFLAELGDYDFVYPSLQAFGEQSCCWQVDDPHWPVILDQNQVSTVAVFRREVWETLGGYRDWGKGEEHLPEDWDFWIRAVAAGFRGAAIRAPLLRYRVRSSSLSRNRTASYREWAAGLAEQNRELVSLSRPAARPISAPRRVAWTSLGDPDPRPAVLMALPFFTEGGAEKIFRALARRWREQGTKVVVITTLELNPESPDRLDHLRRFTRHVFDLPRFLWRREELYGDFVYYLLRRHNISLIYLAGCDLMYQLLPEIRREFPQIAVIDQLFNEEIHFFSNRAFSRWIDCTVVPGERIATRLRAEYGDSANRVALIPHGVRLSGGSSPARPPLPAGFEGKPLVGFFGRFSEEKAPLDFVRIAAAVHGKLPQARFIMTGEGPQREAVEKEIRECRLGRVLLAPGFVQDVRPWIAACDVVVVPSRLDGMPLIVFEAGDLGRCVVASRTGSIPEVIADGETGVLCQPGDIEGFAAAIIRLLESPESRRRIGEQARSRVRQEYSEEVMLDRYFRLFEDLLASRRAPSSAGAGAASSRSPSSIPL